MAKPGVSKKSRQPSKHSRAARRATDVDIDTDKSLKDVKPPSAATERPSVLAAHHNSGVSKKTNNRKSQLSAKAKKRSEKAMDRAEAIMDRTSNKREKSKNSSRTIEARRKGWETINKNIPQKKFPDEEDSEQEVTKARQQVAAEKDSEKDSETDEEMEGADEEPAPTNAAAQAPPPQNDDIDEEIL